MADSPRIEDLRRRVQRDPASIAFAQLAEEYRRAGQSAEAVETCRAGLAQHPGYLSARVTLGRALIELGNLEEGQQELELVLKSAPENLAAIRGVAEVYQRSGDLPKALEFFKLALTLARNDPDLEETVNDLTRQLGPRRGADTGDGLSLEQMRNVFAQHAPPPRPAPVPVPVPVPDPVPIPITVAAPAPQPVAEEPPTEPLIEEYVAEPLLEEQHPAEPAIPPHLLALEGFLAAIHAARAERRA